MAWYLFFFASGFCGLVYEVVWLRLAMASFGVNAPLVSTVLSVFMAGLGLGSWAAGRLLRRSSVSPLKAYAFSELGIGLAGALVPYGLLLGRGLAGGGAAWGTLGYYGVSGLWIALCLLPGCVLMGATFPLAMASIRRSRPESSDGFGRLYLANVGGAAAGTLLSAFFLIEMLGFKRTAFVACAVNALICAGALALERFERRDEGRRRAAAETRPGEQRAAILFLLFATGAASMCSEVIWVRLFIPYLGSTVYTFASILAIYLLATFLGSSAYRAGCSFFGRERLPEERFGGFWAAFGVLGLLPLLGADPRLLEHRLAMDLLRVAVGIGPFCALLGFLTPLLVDRWSGGDPEAGGAAYAVNVAGSLVGPLLAGFVLLPVAGERAGLLMAVVPICAAGLVLSAGAAARWAPAALLLIPLSWTAKSFESVLPDHLTRRDYEATVLAGRRGPAKFLLVNGVSMTMLAPVTKWMAHFPLAVLGRPADRALVVCFGMGTTFRSMLSWGVRTDAVDLVPSVPAFFGYFHPDAPELLASGRGRIIADDGRRYLERTSERYDLITLDPPPPVEAAASSLLYSEEFYQAAAAKLGPDGILQQWLPGAAGPGVRASVAKAFAKSFPNRLVFDFQTAHGAGTFFLGSRAPLSAPSAKELAARLPAAARADIAEWGDHKDAEEVFEEILKGRTTEEALAAKVPGVPAMRDDLPVNEYFLMKTEFPGLWAAWSRLRNRFLPS